MLNQEFLPHWVKWIAKNENRYYYGFNKKPKFKDGFWLSDGVSKLLPPQCFGKEHHILLKDDGIEPSQSLKRILK